MEFAKRLITGLLGDASNGYHSKHMQDSGSPTGEYRALALACYDEFPFHEHPLWRAILRHELSLEAVIAAEVQHYLRTQAGQRLRGRAVTEAKNASSEILKALLSIYIDECAPQNQAGSHLSLIKRLLQGCGVTDDQLALAEPTPGNAAAIALYQDIGLRGAGCHLVGAGAVEHFYSKLCPLIFDAYTTHYGMSAHQAETYSLHGPMDEVHGNLALGTLDEVVRVHGWREARRSIRDAFVATSLHYDGMLQAALGSQGYWDGSTR